jgi:hypothetical protein
MLLLDKQGSTNKKAGIALGAFVTQMQTALVDRMKALVARVCFLEFLKG